MATKFNVRNPAVKRILQEMKEMQADTSSDFIAEALESDIFEWHFVIRGPPDTEFEGGVYHGRVLLPPEYPFKPPAFMMLTPSGRFETNMKVCLSISSHHPEHWQPSWSIRTALMALIGFLPSPGQGALGSLDFTKDERKILAARAHREPPVFGSEERQRVIEDMHMRMVSRMSAADPAMKESEEQHPAAEIRGESAGSDARVESPAVMPPVAAASSPEDIRPTEQAQPVSSPQARGLEPAVAAPLEREEGSSAGAVLQPQDQAREVPAAATAGAASSADQGLTLLAIALAMGIFAILVRKFMGALGDSDLGMYDVSQGLD